jgi:hypothetical protein
MHKDNFTSFTQTSYPSKALNELPAANIQGLFTGYCVLKRPKEGDRFQSQVTY